MHAIRALLGVVALQRSSLALAFLVLHAAVPNPVHAGIPQIAAGWDRTCAVSSDGGALCWGDNQTGALGNGTLILSTTAIRLSGIAPGSTSIASGPGASHTCAVTMTGVVACWGSNSQGQLGNGLAADSAAPVDVPGLPSPVKAVAAGLWHTCALTTTGGVWCWGGNGSGQLGNGAESSSLIPVAVQGLSSGVTAIATGELHTCALTNGGEVRCWGHNAYGQLGDGTQSNRPTPVAVTGITSGAALGAGSNHTCVVTTAGGAYCWGSNAVGQLGASGQDRSPSPIPVTGLSSGVAAIRGGEYHTCALTTAGSMLCWGDNRVGQLGNTPSDYAVFAPASVSGLPAAVASISVGRKHTCAVTTAGATLCWGGNDDGQVGSGTASATPAPTQVSGLPGPIAAIATGELHSCALATSGAVFCWGGNRRLQLGTGRDMVSSVPVPVTGRSTGIATIATGGGHSCAVTTGGGVLCWGDNDFGELGDGTRTSSSSPVSVTGLPGPIRQVAAGSHHTCAVTLAGAAYCWGNNNAGQLGNGTTVNLDSSPAPLPVAGLGSGVVAVATGLNHACALTTSGSVHCWGYNNHGQLGNGTISTIDQNPTPVPVTILSPGVAAIVSGPGADHTCAITMTGRLLCWGSNYYGELGDGTTTDRAVPVAVTGLSSGVAGASAGQTFTCAWTTKGGALCWGSAIGAMPALAPAPVAGLSSNVHAIAAGPYHVCALTASGGVLCWGENSLGALGEGTLATRSAPALVAREGGGGSLAQGNWFLDLDTAASNADLAEWGPVFLASTSGDPTAAVVKVNTEIQFAEADVGRSGSVYIFALAPSDIVRQDKQGGAPFAVGAAVSRSGTKDSSVACVLAQLNSSGQLQAVSSSSLQAYLTGVLSSQRQAVTVVNGVPTANIGGTTFYVGYGTNATAMLNGGVNRSIASVPGPRECRPQPPQTGWWWNPKEAGRGYSIEARGRNLFYAAYLYDDSGRSMWYVATGPASLDGSLFTGDLLALSGGQSLGGAYRPPGTPRVVGPITLAFSDAVSGTMVWPGGTVAIERFNIVPGGLDSPAQPNIPESGWWWNAGESGRGFFVEWQAGTAFIAGYMYDDSGSPVWYVSSYATPAPLVFNGTWWSYANGQTLTGPYKPATLVNANVAPVTIQFDSATTATMTLPGGRLLPLTRFRF